MQHTTTMGDIVRAPECASPHIMEPSEEARMIKTIHLLDNEIDEMMTHRARLREEVMSNLMLKNATYSVIPGGGVAEIESTYEYSTDCAKLREALKDFVDVKTLDAAISIVPPKEVVYKANAVKLKALKALGNPVAGLIDLYHKRHQKSRKLVVRFPQEEVRVTPRVESLT